MQFYAIPVSLIPAVLAVPAVLIPAVPVPKSTVVRSSSDAVLIPVLNRIEPHCSFM